MISKANATSTPSVYSTAKAASLRDQHWGKSITYSRKVFIPLTTMCRDECGYCAFVKRPGSLQAKYLQPEEVLKIARDGCSMGCKEALFSLGEKPEVRYSEACRALARLGYTSTTSYLRDMCERVIAETGLIPHVNAGTLSSEELSMLKEVSGSMGMMLENSSRRLLGKGLPHHACPDKVPKQRIRAIRRAGEMKVPYTTGILIGIGETWNERIESLEMIQSLHSEFGHIQEVIVQNFRRKPGIAMSEHPEPTLEDMVNTLAAAREILDPAISLQAPPNLADDVGSYIDAGINDWGGISPLTVDHINPERAWPIIGDLANVVAKKGYTLAERLPVYSAFLGASNGFIHPKMAIPLERLANQNGLAEPQYIH